jgi:UDP-GlcNAc:undecaprenyl-phosphate GlcNAc-1-phosphate transferase
MILFFICFLAALGINFLVVRFGASRMAWALDSNEGPQKMHRAPTPRIGGLSIYIPLVLVSLFGWSDEIERNHGVELSWLLCLAAAPLFATGLVEDITKRVRIKMRLGVAFVAGALAFYLVDAQINHLDISFLDPFIAIGVVSLLFTAFAIAGVANAYNIIDGLNGLASMVAIIALIAIGIVAIWVEDRTLAYAALWMIGAVLGFFLWNYPKGLIFWAMVAPTPLAFGWPPFRSWWSRAILLYHPGLRCWSTPIRLWRSSLASGGVKCIRAKAQVCPMRRIFIVSFIGAS